MRKITKLICILAMTAGMIPTGVSASESGLEVGQSVEILKSLSILKGDVPQKVNYDYYVMSLSGFLYNDELNIQNAENIARITGMLDSGERYKGMQTVSTDDAVKYAVVTLGYKTLAYSYGGDSGAYSRVAAELGVTDGVTFSGNILTAENMVKILHNMMDVEPMSRYYETGTDLNYGINYGETLLSLNRKIYEVKGVQNGNCNTTLYDEYGCVDGYITIDGVEFEVEDGYTDYLGKNVIAYAEKTGADEYKILYIGEYKNKTLLLNAEDIENIGLEYEYIEYIRDNKTYKAKLSQTPSVIYNGVLHGEYEKEDLMPDTGSLELIDNDRDGSYDVIKVKSYKTVIVDNVSISDKVIRNKYSFSECVPAVELEPDGYEIEYTILKDGAKTDISAINPYDVISVAESKSTDNKIMEILVSGQGVSGTVTEIDNDEKEISIDDKAYFMNAEFIKHSTEKGNLKISKNGEFYLDSFGKIAYFVPASDSEYFMLLRIFEEDEKYYAVYMDLEEEWHTTVLSDRINLDGENVKTSGVYESELKNLKAEIVKLGINSQGELKKIDTPSEVTEYIEGEFIKTPEATYTYRYYEQHFDHKYYLNTGAKAFIIPQNYTTDKDMYSVLNVTSLFDTDVSGCQLSVYDFDMFNFTDIVSIKDNSALENARSTLNLFVVKNVGDRLVNGDVIYGITGNMVNYRNLSLGAEKPEILDGVEVGDVIRLSINGAGEISSVSHVASAKNFVPMEYVGYATNAIMAGTVSKVDLSEGKIKISFGASEKNFRLNTTLGVLTYNVKQNECSYDDISSVAEDKNIICRLKMGRIEEIVVIDEE